MASQEVRVGVVGCGGFGLFALQHFSQIPGVKLVGMAGTAREAARACARRFGIPDIEKVEELAARKDVDLIYIATPPFLHHAQAMLALESGKHVICEKPMALEVSQAEEMIALARRQGLLVVANLMQRYNPLFAAVKKLVESEALGKPLHGYFENYASDEGLSAGHWFWAREKSGGIFREHGVHFFDMFAGWLGEGKVESAQRAIRPGTEIEEQVQCAVRYPGEVLVNFYHGFCQANRMDRQEMKIVFERGDITLFGWIPTYARVHALADEAQTRVLMEIFPDSRLDVTQNYPPKDRAATARHKSFDVYQMIEITHGEGADKMHRYGELLRELTRDQLAWLGNRNRARVITEENGRESLKMAVAADRLACGA